MKEIGYVLSNCSQKFIPFIVKEGEKAFANRYYFIPHPVKSKDSFLPVLIRTFKVIRYNPEMDYGKLGLIAGKKGEPIRYGKYLECEIAFAEALGYFEKGRWNSLECSPETWESVFEPCEEEIRDFFSKPLAKENAYLVKIGYHKGSHVPIFLDLNKLARGHMFVAGMTRSGKSTFVLNLIRKTKDLRPRPRFVVFDRRGEYTSLVKYGAVVLPYHCFLDKTCTLTGKFVAKKLGFSLESSAGKLVSTSVELLKTSKMPIRRDSLWKMVQSLTPIFVFNNKDKVLTRIKLAIDTLGEMLDIENDPVDIIEAILKNPIVVIDFSVDADLNKQLISAKHIIKRIVDHAIKRKDVGDFSVIVVLEEVQYYAPEKGLGIEVGNPHELGTSKTLVEAISQAGGYNVGFIILSQRPAYVMKSVISQCNTIVCFRVMSGNDQDAILRYTEVGSENLREHLPCLGDHEALIWGMASPIPFPVLAQIEVEEYPRKSSLMPKDSWKLMEGIV